MTPSLAEIVRAFDFERLAGTEGERKAAEMLETWLKSVGVATRRESFPIETFANPRAEIHIGDKVFHGLPFGRCRSESVEAPLIFTEHPKGVNLAPERHRGKILLSYGRPRGIYHELKDAGITGMITITPPFRDAQSLSHRQYEEQLIPTVCVDYDTAAQLVNFDGEMCRIVISQENIQSEANNIVAEFSGTDPDGTTTYLVGHYDTVYRSPGACDNAGGTAVLVHLAAHLAAHPPKRDVKIVFFSGEELGLIGSQTYCKVHRDEIKKHGRFVLNVDVTGDDIGTDELYITGSKELMGYAVGLTRADGIICNARLSIYSSDSIPFAQLEVPSVNLARYGGKASFHGHTPDDAPKFITQRGLHNTFRAALAMIEPILNGTYFPFDRVIDDALRPALENYLFGLYGTEPALDWQPKYMQPPTK